jgi:hypothetical protein
MSSVEEQLAALLFDAGALQRPGLDPMFALLDPTELIETAASVRRMVRDRRHRGTGGIVDWYPRTIAAWRVSHPEDAALDRLIGEFCASPHCGAWRELPAGDPGICLEEALYRFFCDIQLGDSNEREDEFLGAVVRALAVTPRASFVWPHALRSAPGGCFALTDKQILHAALDGRYRTGPVTALVAALLIGEPARDVALRFGVDSVEVESVLAALRSMLLL